ncbi:FMN-binding glutamate synthase family protein [Chryseosolibacter indicus]|uniref:FMN-binding glutamate synthase family protein n=1 Tax=Chryseosolibacter indicus TaxID=2782351 RepID=A0ABS5VKM2_9BACT|nr:FMN-binding glutamate synthase family protein [Chryseosolibacter indicus]MBT1701985.1 FMN-binding glutamate synthase family protein [Chryseosolibacter indicus]
MRKIFVISSVSITLLIIVWSLFWLPAFGCLVIVAPFIVMGVQDMVQTKQSIRRNFPLVGRLRYVFEDLRPKIQQYFVESDTDGVPINRNDRSVIYQRAKKQIDTTPFGTQLNVYSEGYEWMSHSIVPIDFHKVDHHPRVTVGNKDCKQPYSASILNVSAMSFGSLSGAAIEALNAGAKLGGFAHNTGEGGISPPHLKYEGDLVWQIGTGYFGARDMEGNFSDDAFRKNALRPQVKMIELKLSQGAKPGHGGILPAKKNTPEIAAIRLVKAGTTVFSPPFHSAFSTPKELIHFVARMRTLSDGKPVGFKLCVGRKSEFISICKAMVELDIYPDFITVDGGEGGTGAAPPEFSNFVGMPLLEGLAFVDNMLKGFNIRHHIKLIASGKILTGFHLIRAMALGADMCNSARAMMMALGCIQALECNKNTCPTGVATQDLELVKGLVVDDKKVRVANFHKHTIESFVELMAAAGIDSPNKLNRHQINRRVFMNEIKTFEEIYPSIPPGSMLGSTIPDRYQKSYESASAEKF